MGKCDVCGLKHRHLENVGSYAMCPLCKREYEVYLRQQISKLLTEWVFKKQYDLKHNLPKCPKCEGDNYEPIFFDSEESGAAFLCRVCGHEWKHLLKYKERKKEGKEN